MGGKGGKQEKNSKKIMSILFQAVTPNNNKLKYSQLLIKTTEIDYLSAFYNLGRFVNFLKLK